MERVINQHPGPYSSESVCVLGLRFNITMKNCCSRRKSLFVLLMVMVIICNCYIAPNKFRSLPNCSRYEYQPGSTARRFIISDTINWQSLARMTLLSCLFASLVVDLSTELVSTKDQDLTHLRWL